jgi:hypothetical protein
VSRLISKSARPQSWLLEERRRQGLAVIFRREPLEPDPIRLNRIGAFVFAFTRIL